MPLERFLVAAFLFFSVAARAQTPAEILKMTDDAHSSFKDLIIDSRMLIHDPGGGAPREFDFTTTLKGEEKRLVRFTAPGEFKGMGMLAEGRDTMYVYLPGYQRVRRMATHLKNQSFAGSDFGYEDMNDTTYTGYYQAALAGTDGNNWMLDLALLPGKEAEFPKLKVWVDKTHHQATKIEYYDATGKKARTMLREEYRKDEGPGNHLSPARVTMIDHRRNNHSTTIELVRSRLNSGVSDDVFSQRNLARGQ